MMLWMGVLALLAVVLAVRTAFGLARRQAEAERPPASTPRDFVAPLSGGGFVWRGVDESPEEFRARVAGEAERRDRVTPGVRSAR
jgi:hypothetical protein